MMNPFSYLPVAEDWQPKVSALPLEASLDSWEKLRSLAKAQLDFPMTLRLDRALQKRFRAEPPPGLQTKPVRLAILGSSSVEHFAPGTRVGGLRHGIWIDLYLGNYGQYRQELMDEGSALYQFRPNAILLSFDSGHLFGDLEASANKSAESLCEHVIEDLKSLWQRAQDAFECQVIQQTLLQVAPALLGQNEHRLPSSILNLTYRLNKMLAKAADESAVDLLSIDKEALKTGLPFWHDPTLWNKAKQEISPNAAPVYGELVARLLSAAQGGSAKCLVMDLDNTLWGGVVGEDGLSGISLGQGSPLGEAFLAIQHYALALSHRGVILAVCSKNDEANALLPFEKHSEMVLRRGDIACFVANWQDKASNLREIARKLNIGLDALVFLDDNPFERNLVRQELPSVRVPELPEDPAFFTFALAEAGYFEALSLTDDDRNRGEQYHANEKREELKSRSSDIKTYLAGLAMELRWSAITSVDLPRAVQLINKTNQFNLTTRRYAEVEMLQFVKNPTMLTLQFRLLDRFGDNGIIAVLIGRPGGSSEMWLDTWLMSCRVLGRGVEKAMLAVVRSECLKMGVSRLIGEFRPSGKNGMVAEHYRSLGFSQMESRDGTHTLWSLDLEGWRHEIDHLFTFTPSI